MPVLVLVPAGTELDSDADVDSVADTPEVIAELELVEPEAALSVPVPDDAVEEVEILEQGVFDGVVETDPEPAAVVGEEVLQVAVTGGILIGALTDEHTDVTASETEDWSGRLHAPCTQGVMALTRLGTAQWQVKFARMGQPSFCKAERKQLS